MKQLIHSSLFIFVLCVALIASVDASFAQSDMLDVSSLSVAQGANAESAECTKDFPKGDNKDGILTQVIDYIKQVIDRATEELYTGIVTNQKFVNAVNAAFILFITIYGVMFTFGIVPLTLAQAVIRLFKMAIILAMINEGFAFFKEYAVTFFNDGTDDLIEAVLSIATGDSSGASAAPGDHPQPFKKIEGLVGNIISPEMMVTIVASFMEGPQGPAMSTLLGVGMMGFIHTIIKALKVYCLALVAKALLFGLAPIFVSFIMFERTKTMFTGWLNQLVNFSLQPLFMFAFLSFYIILLESAAQNILGANICWTEFQQLTGSPHLGATWRFHSGDATWQGSLECLAEGSGNCPAFPVGIIDILAFFILAHLAYRFADVVVQIASEIASSTLFLNQVRSGLGQYFKGDSGAGRAAAVARAGGDLAGRGLPRTGGNSPGGEP